MHCKWKLITVYLSWLHYEAFVYDIACIFCTDTCNRKSFVRYGIFLLHSNVLNILGIFEVNNRVKAFPSKSNDIVQLFENAGLFEPIWFENNVQTATIQLSSANGFLRVENTGN